MKDNLYASRRVRFAAGIASIALLTSIGFGLCRWVDWIRARLIYFTIGLCALAGVLFLIRLILKNVSDTEEKVLRCYENPSFWGSCLCVASVLNFVVISLIMAPTQIVRARTPVVPEATPPKLEFPELQIDGVMLSGFRSQAVINRHPVRLGEFVERVKLVEVFEDGVTVEMEGQQRRYYRNTTHPVLVEEDNPMSLHNIEASE